MEKDFVVARVDLEGTLPPTYLRKFALAGKSGLRQLAFGGREGAHLFASRAEAEEVARRLRRRVPDAQYDFIVEEAPVAAAALANAVHSG